MYYPVGLQNNTVRKFCSYRVPYSTGWYTYYLQVDVVDSEYARLTKDIAEEIIALHGEQAKKPNPTPSGEATDSNCSESDSDSSSDSSDAEAEGVRQYVQQLHGKLSRADQAEKLTRIAQVTESLGRFSFGTTRVLRRKTVYCRGLDVKSPRKTLKLEADGCRAV